MERVESVESCIEVFENDLEYYLNEYQVDNNIDDFSSVPQNVWSGALIYANKKVFKPNPGLLKQKQTTPNGHYDTRTNFNAYDYELVNQLCDYYISKCMMHNKEVSLRGFSFLTGINIDTLIDWGKGSTRLSQVSCEIYKKLHDLREESLSAKLSDGKQNPVGLIAILNKHYGWNMPGVSRESASRPQLSSAELPRLDRIASHNDCECVQLEDKTVKTSEIVDNIQ